MTALPEGLTAGTYNFDPTHSAASFVVRHAGISKVRGSLAITSGQVVVGESREDTSATAEIDAASVDTGNETRDAHLRSADFWDAEKNPTWTFTSTSVKPGGEGFILTGELTLAGVTKSVELDTEYTGSATDPWGNLRAGCEATTQISRKDFGITWNQAL